MSFEESVVIVVIKKLGLAAYLKYKGCNLTKVDNREFHFETDRSVKEWSLEYSNSCCFKHDVEVCELRKLLTAEG